MACFKHALNLTAPPGSLLMQGSQLFRIWKIGSELSQSEAETQIAPVTCQPPPLTNFIRYHTCPHPVSPVLPADTNCMMPRFRQWLRKCISGCSQGKVPLSVQLCSATVCETLTLLCLDFCLLPFVLSGVPHPCFPPWALWFLIAQFYLAWCFSGPRMLYSWTDSV